MNKSIVLNEVQIEEIKKLADDTRKLFGVYVDIPIANDIQILLEKSGIILCEYPFQASEDSHTDATITWFETQDGPMTFIGLNTALFYDEQIFAMAHELYHFQTKTGKAYMTDIEKEDPVIEKKADRYAAELLLPRDILHSRISAEFPGNKINCTTKLRLLRFIARLQCEWWLPYHSILNRLLEEGHLNADIYEMLYQIDDRDAMGEYSRILRGLDGKKYELFNCRTNRKGISNMALEAIIQNYEDGAITEDEFASHLELFGKSPSDFGFEISAEDDELALLFEGGDDDVC